ncbi:discoidin domain-containing protein [Streptomyces sp. NPDC060022]|uniref:discoidin domain-containing protein n=1 Tax=Streptomyces sp. NPDC060022 TaxID=3347039 RepID=UPI0036A32FAD
MSPRPLHQYPTPAHARRGRPRRPRHARNAFASSLTLATAPTAVAAESLSSQGKTATASSVEGEVLSAAAAFDGNLTGTRWASQWRDAEWIQVGLGASRNLSRVVLMWEGAFGKNYEIQVSDDGTNWRTAKSVTGSDGVPTRSRSPAVDATCG